MYTTINSNEGTQSVSLGQTVSFTFQVPAGLWGGAMIVVDTGTGDYSAILAYADGAGAAGEETAAVGTLFEPPNHPAYEGYAFGDELTGGATNSNPFHNLMPTDPGGPYSYYATLKNGSTASVKITLTNDPRNQPLGSVTAFLLLAPAAIPPAPPAPPPPPPPPPFPTGLLGSYALAEDAHGRPVALSPNLAAKIGISGAIFASGGYFATSINALVSSTAGKTYLLDPLSDIADSYQTPYNADNPSLLVDLRSNHYRAIYSKVQSGHPQILLKTGLLDDRFSSSQSAPFSGYTGVCLIPAIPGISGGLCVAAQHPTDADYALLVYSDIGTAAAPGSNDLKAAFSVDAGATWQPLPTVLPGLVLTGTGRPALCWLGNTAVLVYSQGSTLYALTSVDRGKSWKAAPGALSTYTPNDGTNYSTYGYYCLSAASHGGQVYLLAFAGNLQAKPQPPPQTSPRLFVSGNGGKSWMLRAAEAACPLSAPAEYSTPPPGVFPSVYNMVLRGEASIAAPSGIGVSPASGLLRLDTSFVSHDCGLTWMAP